jgi:hypothetical protein
MPLAAIFPEVPPQDIKKRESTADRKNNKMDFILFVGDLLFIPDQFKDGNLLCF